MGTYFGWLLNSTTSGNLISGVETSETFARNLLVDIHGHWLYGVDDGALDLQESIAMIKGLKQLGFKRIIATPHIKTHYLENNPDLLLNRFYRLSQELLGHSIDIQIGLGAEYTLDEGFRLHLKENNFLTIDDELLLIDFPFGDFLPDTAEILEELKSLGYRVIIAHPERYNYIFDNLDKYMVLKETGCYFQLNIGSLNKFYGREIQRVATTLLEENLYEFVGTDIHSLAQLKSFSTISLSGTFKNKDLLTPVAVAE